MSKRKPQTIEELREFLETHKEDGKLNGQEVATIKVGTRLVSGGFVTGDAYNQALLKGAALSFSKSDIGTFALGLYLADTKYVTQIDGGLLSTEFPFEVPINIYEAAIQKAESQRLTLSEMLTHSLILFANSPGIVAIYEAYINNLCQVHGCDRNYAEMKIFGWRRYKAREARLALSLQQGSFVTSRKIPS